ncbi:MAG: hypothetical protein JSS61_07470 [Verrucomicrobia bacterium]|nr:hypothetical protein [Verrucomicrobiota bacterium]
MLIGIAILSLLAGVIAVPIHKLIQTYRFEKEVSSLFIRIQEAQLLSATYQTDVTLDIYSQKGALSYRFDTYEPFKNHQLHKDPVPLSHVDTLDLNGKKVKECHFTFPGTGEISPTGTLLFSHEQNALSIEMQPLLKLKKVVCN